MVYNKLLNYIKVLLKQYHEFLIEKKLSIKFVGM